MTIANRLRQYLESEQVRYDIVPHPRAVTSSRTAQAAHVPGQLVAKSVVVHHELGYVLVVAPSTHRVELDTLQEFLNRRLGLAAEDEVARLFDDCDRGAIPPIGAPDCRPSWMKAWRMFQMSISKAVITRAWCMSPAIPSGH